MNEVIERNFKYHPPKDGQPEKYQNIREKSLAMTKLEESCFWANASIARNE